MIETGHCDDFASLPHSPTLWVRACVCGVGGWEGGGVEKGGCFVGEWGGLSMFI